MRPRGLSGIHEELKPFRGSRRRASARLFFAQVFAQYQGYKALPRLEKGAKQRCKGRLMLFGPKKSLDFWKAPGAAMALPKGEGGVFKIKR